MKELELEFNPETGTWGTRKEPYATVECETQEDYERLQKLVELGKNAEKAIEYLTELAEQNAAWQRWGAADAYRTAVRAIEQGGKEP